MMKKTISNIRTMAALLMAGAAFAACSNSDDIISELPANTVKQGYTLTVSASKDGSTTRALSLEGTAVVASWETTDEIVVTKNGTQVGTLSPTNINGLEATFSGTVDGDFAASDVLTLSYHPIAGIEGFASQNGTLNGLATSAENFDMAIATVHISGISGKNIIVSESSANFVNQTAVVVLSPYNSSWDEYHSLNSLTVSVTMDISEVGTVTEKIGPITVTGDQPHYFSLPSQSLLAEVLAAKYSLSASAVSTLLASATVTFTGHQTGDDYDREYLTCSKTGYKFAAGKYYKLDNSNFSMTMLYKRAVADKDVYVESQDVSWSHTVTFAVNKEIGWKVVGDYVFCGDKQLYVVDNSGPEPSEGWVKASDDHIPFGATYTLEDPAPATPDVTWDLSEMSSVGYFSLQDGLTYKGVTLSGSSGAADFADQRNIIANNGATFTAPAGKKFTSIVVSGTYARFEGEGWTVDGNTCSTWTGSAESVAFTGQSYMMTTIEFYLDSPLDPAPAPSYTMAADAASGDVGKLICTDGHIHAYGEDAECTATRVAKIIYVGNNTDNTTYTHGLALALADEDQSNWSTAVSTCTAKNTSTPVAGASWMLPSRPQWEAMGATQGSSTKATLRDGFSNVGGTNMQENVYWSSTEIAGETQYVYYYWFGDDYDLYWMECGKNEEIGIDTRACLVF